jgi:hypothetical protein
MSTTRWRKSSFSGGTENNCVELDRRADRTGIRDSKDPAAGSLTVPPAAWTALAHRITQGS